MMRPAQVKEVRINPVLLVVTTSMAVLNEANRERQKRLLKLDNNGIDLSQIDMVAVVPERLQEAVATFYGNVAGVIIDTPAAYKALADSMEALTGCVAFSLTSGACSSNAKAAKDRMTTICGERFAPQWSAKLTKGACTAITSKN